VPEDFTLSDKNIAQVQARLPNRNGMTTAHGMWQVSGTPDVKATACMTQCAAEVKITSTLPTFARNAHDNLADQNRIFGPYRGIDSTQPPLPALPGAGYVTKVSTASAIPATAATTPATSNVNAAALQQSFTKNNCAACHAPAAKGVGPSIADIAKKYIGQDKKYKDPDTLATLSAKVKKGGAGAWGVIPMPPHSGIPDDEISRLVHWMLTGS
jgi:cytochrome c